MEKREMFRSMCDLGIITVPDKYVPTINFSWGHFPTPSRILRPGDRLWVRIHQQVVEKTTSEERLAFLESLEGAHHVGAQGALLVREQKSALLPKDYYCASFDKKEALWWDPLSGEHRVPEVAKEFLSLGFFERPWTPEFLFLSFCDESQCLMGLS